MNNLQRCPNCENIAMPISKRLLGSQRNMSCTSCGASLKPDIAWFLFMLVSVAILSSLANIVFGPNKFYYVGITLVAYFLYCWLVPLKLKEEKVPKNTKPLQWYQSPIFILIPLLIGVLWVMFNYV